jgi:hypothetical protein
MRWSGRSCRVKLGEGGLGMRLYYGVCCARLLIFLEAKPLDEI